MYIYITSIQYNILYTGSTVIQKILMIDTHTICDSSLSIVPYYEVSYIYELYSRYIY